jgi:uncharacterized protein YjgD (DUF1641 family)
MATEKARSTIKRRDKEQQVSIEFPTPRMLELLAAVEKRGLLEAATGVLNDEVTFSELMKFFSGDDALHVIQNAKPIIKLLAAVDYDTLTDLADALKTEKQALSGAKSLIRLLGALESRGLIEPVVGLLYDEKAFSNLAKLLSSDTSLAIVNNLQSLTQFAVLLEPEALDVLSKVAGSLKTDVKPVKGVLAVSRELSDPEVAMGVGRLFEILRVLGRYAQSRKAEHIG